MSNKPEVWLRGPLPNMPPLVQPVAHALLQSREEVQALMAGFPADKLWQKVAGMASAGFHLQHLSGVLDRLFTYARGEALTDVQLQALQAEAKPTGDANEVMALVEKFSQQIDAALNQLRQTNEQQLTEVRSVGRAQVPSTMLGLYVHSAEHTMRHVGQLLVTVNVLKAEP
jgi:uncharacterized damage-inducible protein DinB